jgi:hypothetical protein
MDKQALGVIKKKKQKKSKEREREREEKGGKEWNMWRPVMT